MGGGQVRIISGTLRGRKLSVPRIAELRPTADRVRETLFNWLQPLVAGSRCLDCFAGTGALSFEALSRGAAEVVLIECHRGQVARLRQTAVQFGVSAHTKIHCADAYRWLVRTPPEPFDMIFLDPPFADDRLGTLCNQLISDGWLTPQATLYLEQSVHREPPLLPAGWSWWRQQTSGEVWFALAQAMV